MRAFLLRLAPHASRLTLLIALAVSSSAHADQYRSETRELETPPPEKPRQDEQKLLQSATDPYAKALLLRDLAAAAAGNKDYAQAAKLLEQALGQNALSGIAAEQMKKDLSQLYLATGNYRKMLPQLEAQVKAGNAAAETYIALGAAYVEQKRFKDAVPVLQKGIALSKTPDPSWKRALLSAMFGAGQTKEVLPLLEQLIREDPTHADDWDRVIALTLKAGNKERALGYMELASRLGYLDTADKKLRLINLTAQLGIPFEAGSLLQNWMNSGALPKNPENWKYLATLWLNARESKLALPALEEAAGRAPSKELYLQLGQLHMDREEYAQAASALERAVALGAKTGPVLMMLGMARYQQADVDSAVRAFREAGQFAPSKKLAMQWVQYLETGKARDQAMAAAAQRRAHDEDVATLSSRLLGGNVEVGAGEGGYAPSVSTRASGGDPFTPVGAERPGNADNSIPPWTGGLQRAEIPADFKPGGKLVDPFPNDRPLYIITAANAEQYRDKLSKGHLALLKKYPSYQMPVYQTRRTAAYPQAIYDATQLNLGKARLLGSDALEGARLGFPFPKPQSGVEIMWNHRTRYRGDTVAATYTQAVVNTDGGSIRNKQTFRVMFRYGNIKDPVDIAQKNILLYGITYVSENGRDPDFLALFHETANSIKDSRDVWVLIVKLGRMLRIPPVGYDQPFPASGGLEFIDMVDMYNGAFDRYVWKLVGKREMLIPYNAYRLSDGHYKNAQLLRPYHLNQEGARYELHRVWVIEASERGGKRHVFGKRIFYVDEDSWNVVMVENQDHDGNLWRFQEGHLTPLYDIQAVTSLPTITYDLKDGRYFANRLFSEDGNFQYDLPMKESEFLPAAVKNKYSR